MPAIASDDLSQSQAEKGFHPYTRYIIYCSAYVEEIAKGWEKNSHTPDLSSKVSQLVARATLSSHQPGGPFIPARGCRWRSRGLIEFLAKPKFRLEADIVAAARVGGKAIPRIAFPTSLPNKGKVDCAAACKGLQPAGVYFGAGRRDSIGDFGPST
jgi:hypothetical protein